MRAKTATGCATVQTSGWLSSLPFPGGLTDQRLDLLAGNIGDLAISGAIYDEADATGYVLEDDRVVLQRGGLHKQLIQYAIDLIGEIDGRERATEGRDPARWRFHSSRSTGGRSLGRRGHALR